MNTKTVVAFLISIALLSVAGCATKAIYNVSNAPVAPTKANPTVDEVRQSIIRAGAALGWQMKEVNPGHVLGTLHLRTHMAAVDVTYDTKAYSIMYKDSKDLNYDGTTIHNNYNGWIQNLEKGIRAQLSLL